MWSPCYAVARQYDEMWCCLSISGCYIKSAVRACNPDQKYRSYKDMYTYDLQYLWLTCKLLGCLLTFFLMVLERDYHRVIFLFRSFSEDKPVRMTRPRGSSRVHFPEDVHDPEIHVSREINSTIDVNLGFLQSSHRYRASFSVADTLKGDIEIPLPVQTTGVVNAEAHPTQNGEFLWVFNCIVGNQRDYGADILIFLPLKSM